MMAGDVGDRAQHQGRGHRQFDRQRHKPEETGHATAQPRQERAGATLRQRLRTRLDRGDRDVEAIEDRSLDRSIKATRRRFRQQPQHAVDRPAGIIGKLGGEALIFEVEDRLPERLQLGRCERRQQIAFGFGKRH
jgi:hypothetical protein